ncbi:hypothetical protein B0H14DRAFT_2577260 [Mycena olivaceomarginata]|nr:hypothetical protein B0H14DRAFT_2577260 [Mycena olivaceomarginata]
MLRWFTQSRKFCEEIAEVDLTAEQIIFSILVGEVRMPFYMLPDHPNHQNPLFKEIFGAAIQQVAKILMDFDLSHPVVANFAEHFKSVKAAERRRRVPDWMRTIGLTPTPELEAVISPPLTSLPGHSLLSHIPLSERQERVLINFEYLMEKTVNLNESTWFKAVSKRGEAFRYIGLGNGLCVAWPEPYKLTVNKPYACLRIPVQCWPGTGTATFLFTRFSSGMAQDRALPLVGPTSIMKEWADAQPPNSSANPDFRVAVLWHPIT